MAACCSRAQLDDPLAFFAYVSAERPGAFANRTMNLDVHGTRAQLLIRAWDDDPDVGPSR